MVKTPQVDLDMLVVADTARGRDLKYQLMRSEVSAETGMAGLLES